LKEHISEKIEITITLKDIEWKYVRGNGPGG
jgi:protein subunit release factor B